MANILLDYAFKVSAIVPTAAGTTAFLNKVCIVVKPTGEVATGVIVECTTNAEIAALTANTEGQQLLTAGMSSVFVLPMDDLQLTDALAGSLSDFFTVLISSDFDDEDEDALATGDVEITSYANLVDTGDDEITVGATTFVAQAGAATLGEATFQAASSNDATATSLAAQINAHATAGALVTALAVGAVVTITAKTATAPGALGNVIALAYSDEGSSTVGATVSGAFLTGGTAALDVGLFTGVVGRYRQDEDEAATIAAITNHSGWFASATNKAKNMFYAFGKLLSNTSAWRNNQYISMPVGAEVITLGAAEGLFDDRVSFVMTDDQYSHRLGLFAVGGKAIVEPYIKRNLEIDLQSAALTYISGNQPAYTNVYATQLENVLQKVIQNSYIDTGMLEDGTVQVTLVEDNFVASGSINIAEPKALWRVDAEMRQTL